MVSKNKVEIKTEDKQEAKPQFSYEIGSNIITIDGATKYLTKILWEDNLTYEQVKEFIVE